MRQFLFPGRERFARETVEKAGISWQNSWNIQSIEGFTSATPEGTALRLDSGAGYFVTVTETGAEKNGFLAYTVTGDTPTGLVVPPLTVYGGVAT